jgi:hypothetical protein
MLLNTVYTLNDSQSVSKIGKRIERLKRERNIHSLRHCVKVSVTTRLPCFGKRIPAHLFLYSFIVKRVRNNIPEPA